MRDRPRVLIVDDYPDATTYLALLLEGAGYEPVEARSREEALAAIDRQPPEVILLDVNLNGDDAIDTCRTIGGRARAVGAAVVLVTGMPDTDDLREAAGAAGVLTKPVLPDVVLETLGTLAPPVQRPA